MKTNKRIDELVNEIGKEEILNYLNNANRFLTYTDIKSYNDACEYLEVSDEDKIYNTDSKYIKGLKKLVHVYKAINKLNNWTPDFTDSNQKKWYPYFKVSSGIACSHTRYDYDFTYSTVGVRLCTYSENVAIYIGKTFTTEYEDFLL